MFLHTLQQVVELDAAAPEVLSAIDGLVPARDALQPRWVDLLSLTNGALLPLGQTALPADTYTHAAARAGAELGEGPAGQRGAAHGRRSNA